jgi:DNA-binding PadR family transcriptional regulator
MVDVRAMGTMSEGTMAMARARRQREATSAEYALLGLLALSDDRRHGYDLSREFQPGGALADVIRLEPGMLYHHLKRLEGRGWAEADRQPIPNRPPRQSYTVTAPGVAALDSWLTEPVSHTREIRLEFLVKLYLAHLRDPELAKRLIAEQRAILASLAASLRAQVDELPANAFPAAVNTLRLAQTDAALAWLDALTGFPLSYAEGS